MNNKRVTYNKELVDSYDWDNIHSLYMKGYGIPYLMDNVIPRELGLRHRYQVVRILTKRYGDVRRKTNTLLSSLMKDYPEYGKSLMRSADGLRGETRFYSKSKLNTKSKYNSAVYCNGVDAQYQRTYYDGLNYANETSEKWRYSKDGLRLPLLIMFTTSTMRVLSSVMEVLSQDFVASMYSTIVGGVSPILEGEYELATDTSFGAQ